MRAGMAELGDARNLNVNQLARKSEFLFQRSSEVGVGGL